jgi:hypothetical protein
MTDPRATGLTTGLTTGRPSSKRRARPGFFLAKILICRTHKGRSVQKDAPHG